MASKIAIENREAYLLLRMTGTWSLENAYQKDRDAIRLCREHKIFRVLSDMCKLTGRLSAKEEFELASSLPDRSGSSFERCATVDLTEHQFNHQVYSEACASHGLLAHYFADLDEADVWLRAR